MALNVVALVRLITLPNATPPHECKPVTIIYDDQEFTVEAGETIYLNSSPTNVKVEPLKPAPPDAEIPSPSDKPKGDPTVEELKEYDPYDSDHYQRTFGVS